MDALEDAPHIESSRLQAHRRRSAVLLRALPALVALVTLPVAAGCGGESAATTAVTPGSGAPTPAVATEDGLGPPKASGGLCERTAADEKSLPPSARLTVERFIAAADRGDHEAMRALFDPSGADEVLAHLRPVTRLGLRALEDRY